MNVKTKAVALMLGVLVVGVCLGVFLSQFVSLEKMSVCAEAKNYAAKVKIEVYDEVDKKWYAQTFDVDNFYVKVIFAQTGGIALALAEPVEWQIVLGMEDHPQDGKGDFADSILKIIKTEAGVVWFEVACLGTFHKKVYYGDALMMEVPDNQNPRISWVCWTA